MTADTFDAHFDHFTWTAVRLQALPEYEVGGAEAKRIQAYRDGLPRPERSVLTDPWLARIALTTVCKKWRKKWRKVCVVDDPLTPYQRQQMQSHLEDQAVGNKILIARRGDVPDHGPDAWVFDAGMPSAHALAMRYSPDGHWLGYEHVTDADRVAEIAVRIEHVQDHAVPLNVFLATVTSA